MQGILYMPQNLQTGSSPTTKHFGKCLSFKKHKTKTSITPKNIIHSIIATLSTRNYFDFISIDQKKKINSNIL